MVSVAGFSLTACRAALELDNLRLKQNEGALTNTQAVHDWVMQNVVNDAEPSLSGIAITHNAALESCLVDRTVTDVNHFRGVLAAHCRRMATLINVPAEASEETIQAMINWCLALSTVARRYEYEWNQSYRRYICAA